MRRLIPVIASLTVVFAASSALAADIRVPDDQPTLADAAANAKPGDRIILGGILSTADDVQFADDVTIVTRKASVRSFLLLRGNGLTVENLHMSRGTLSVVGDNVTIRDSRFLNGSALIVSGDQARVLHNRISRPAGSGMNVFGDNAVVTNNRIRAVDPHEDDRSSLVPTNAAIRLFGDRSVIQNNRIARSTIGIFVSGADALIDHNFIRTKRIDQIPARGIDLRSTGTESRITQNRLRADSAGGILVEGHNVVVDDNRIRARRGTLFGVHARGSDNTVTSNVVGGAADRRQIQLIGDRNRVTHNRSRFITVVGNDNDVRDNRTREEFVAPAE